MASPPTEHQSGIFEFLSQAWGWLAAAIGGIFALGKQASRIDQFEHVQAEHTKVIESIPVIQNDIKWIRDTLEKHGKD